MNINDSIEMMQRAISMAEELNGAQKHEDATYLLQFAIAESKEEWEGASDLEIRRYNDLVQTASEEAENQARRQLLLEQYLNA